MLTDSGGSGIPFCFSRMENDVSLASAWAPEARSPDAELPLTVLLVGGFIMNVNVCVERWRPLSFVDVAQHLL